MLPRSLGLALFLTVLSSQAQPARAAEPAARPPQWNRTMQELYRTLTELVADVSSDSRYSDPRNQARIEKNARQLSKLAHSIKTSAKTAPDADPTVAMLGDSFDGEAARAYQSFRRGNKEYARGLLRGMSSFCIACHTRTGAGPSFARLPSEPDARLKPAERGAFFAATRQYDRAIETFKDAIAEPAAGGPRSGEWIHAVRNALAIAVRVKQDPDLALSIVDKVIATRGAPLYLVTDARAWRQSLLDWKNEPARKITGEDGLHAEAVRLLTQAHSTQKYPVDRSADILYLRATAATHELLRTAPGGRHAAEAFLMAGIAYEVLKPFRMNELNDTYYEGCVRRSPRTQLAEECYRRLEASVYDGFTGSAGTDVPSEVQAHLDAVRAQARIETIAP